MYSKCSNNKGVCVCEREREREREIEGRGGDSNYHFYEEKNQMEFFHCQKKRKESSFVLRHAIK